MFFELLFFNIQFLLNIYFYLNINHNNDNNKDKMIIKTDIKPSEILLESIRIIDFKIMHYTGISYVLYKLEIKTKNYKTLYCWKRYRDFELLYNTLINEKKYTKHILPKLPKKIIFGNLNHKKINKRILSLNNFLDIMCYDLRLQWGIYINDDIQVYKRRFRDFYNQSK